MATSNNTINQLTRDDFINAALRKLGVVGEGQVANAQQLSDGAEALNLVLKDLQALGMHLWKREEYSVPLVSGQKEYTMGIGKSLNIPYPLKVSQANLAIAGSTSRMNMEVKAHYDYNNLPVIAFGTPVCITYQPFINYGVLSVWPTPNDSVPAGSSIYITYQRPFDKFTSGTETADVPEEWEHAVVYQLAHVLSDDYALPLEDRRWFEKQAEKRLANATSFGAEDASIFFYRERGG